MENYKEEILVKICYTELVYGRINKKLNKELSKAEIEEMILKVPFAKVTYTFREEICYALILYFIEHNKQNVVFYGYRINPITRMME